jgi:hypothetical protein
VVVFHQNRVPQRWGWLHSGGHRAGDGHTGSEVMEKTCSAHPASRRRPGRAPGWWAYAPRGRRCPFSRGAALRKDGSGWHSVDNHPAQHLYSAGDSRTVADCLNNAGVGFPSCISRSAWRGFAFDLGFRGVSEHLTLRSGEQVRRRGLREASSEAETRPRGRGPQTRRRSAQGGVVPSSGNGVLRCGARPSSETGVHSRVAGDGGSVGH